MVWLLLVLAIVAEVAATLSLRMASAPKANKWWYLPVIAGYIVAFSLLSVCLSLGMALGVAYGIWAASGVALTAVLSKFLFKEAFTWVMALGIAAIIGGVLLIELGAGH